MTLANTAERVAEVLRSGLENLAGRGPRINEAVTRSVLIDRVLEELGYPPSHRSPEDGAQGNRPDDLCFLNPVRSSPGYPALVIEAKRLGAKFDEAPTHLPRSSSPDRQIQRYLSAPTISGPDTIGVLTDGVRWRVYRRTDGPATTDIHYYDYFDLKDVADGLQPALGSTGFGRLRAFVEQLSRGAIASRTLPSASPISNLADQLFEIASRTDVQGRAEQIVKAILGEPNAIVSDRLENAETLTGIRKDMHDRDWERYIIAKGPNLSTLQPGLDGTSIVVGAVQFSNSPNLEISKGDAALCARTLASTSTGKAAVVFVYEIDSNGTMRARMAVAVDGQVNMTAGFDPALPSPATRLAIDQQLRLLRNTRTPITAEKLLAPFGVATLRHQFYREVALWTARVQRERDQAGREAVLRHLIRVMFAWILKEDNHIPPEIFESAFNAVFLDTLDDYHNNVLLFLFRERLNKHQDLRDEHPIHPINEALDRAPFLNGSLFAGQDGDDGLDLKATDYWSVDGENPGLFTILSRYHWTMDEHRPGESEQTLDPELLSNLFERLIAPTERGAESPPLRQPKGTYYTPADIADEMVKDALAAAVADCGGPLDERDLIDLFGDEETQFPAMATEDLGRLVARVREIRIFDPAVGSGEFLFSSLLSIRRALRKLGVEEPAEAIIKRQLRGQDINPLAVQIARLRLFIAITAARKELPSTGLLSAESEPLPNLEAVIVCADTLETVADPEWRSAQLDMADHRVGQSVSEIVNIRSRWFDAHSESEKMELLSQDENLRAKLATLLQQKGALASPELIAFAKSGLLTNGPAKTDARLLFYENPWIGFDIVVGNPPYEALQKSKSATEIKDLANGKRYRTTGGGDLFNLFCETALALARPDGGVVSLIVPLSISFGQNKQELRDIFNRRSKSITLRHYDNNPGRTFTDSPTVRDIRNNQRVTVVMSVLGSTQSPEIESMGLQRWPSREREMCIRQRPKANLKNVGGGLDIHISGQWARIPTTAISEMVQAITRQEFTIGSRSSTEGKYLGFPKTARYFISSIPAGSLWPRSENLFRVANDNDLLLAMATLNGHVGYGWWRAFGDGFHVNAYELTSIKIPDAWIKHPQQPIQIAQRLLDCMPSCITKHPKEGVNWVNVDFHTYAPHLILELDRLHIAALGLPEEPLLSHLQIMRSSSSWCYTPE